MALGMRRKFMISETVAKSEFYVNSTKEVLNNTIATALTQQLFLLELNKSAVQIGLKKCLILSTFSGYWETKVL